MGDGRLAVLELRDVRGKAREAAEALRARAEEALELTERIEEITGGDVRSGDAIRVEPPPGPHRLLEPVVGLIHKALETLDAEVLV